MAPTFVMSTGRCGSTLVSRMLRLHPDVLSLSELLTTVRDRLQFHDAPDGEQFWRILCDPDPILDVMVAEGLQVSEMIYPYGTGQFDPAEGIPAICHMTLPMLTDDPDALHDELAAEVSTWPARPLADQIRALFAYLAERLHRPVVVERSGASLRNLPQLREQFAEARFVYLTRDGADTALSMSRHAGFGMKLLADEAARIAGLASSQQLRADHSQLLPAELGRLLSNPSELPALMRRDIPVTAFGALWSTMTCEGADALLQLPAGRWMMTSYEALVADAPAELTRLAGFLGTPAPAAWLTEAARLVDPGRRAASTRLDPRLLAALRRSCAPGTALDTTLAEAAGIDLVPAAR
ncbi:sulfotransferase domain-containing protein [Streptomyces sp. NL15-2K]|uniref:sulfotransferase domain-containing protein n=1 Tax=Streptomyces sp. NL15-2K TaxID=376149 RepID=UPI000F56E61F|nr:MULTISPECIES: sulfotransferase domain-containing protein [Actinomycetes]WKX14215.1 sulfotransferase domain-containing protein [Kutzneria buriramensis]GCB43885.1 hypothetical protein SNL152K_1170 [Streptomyces sp. NL15-2K]